MESKESELLRLHIEAVWGVLLPPLVHNECELLPTSNRPIWRLYVADIAAARIYIWHPDVVGGEREALRSRASAVLASPPASASLVGVKREVALAFTASPALELNAAHGIARPLSVQDQALIERFESGSSSYMLHPAKRPLIGVVDSSGLLCIAHSSRRTDVACELGIETLPSARRKGYALAATILWTHAVLQEGLVPIYSTFAENTPSLNLAAEAGYRAFVHGATVV